MTLEEAIRHCEDVADGEVCEGCAKEHEQLGVWLSKLKLICDMVERYRDPAIYEDWGIGASSTAWHKVVEIIEAES